MIKPLIVLLALASAARLSLPHHQLQPHSKWVPGGLELIQQDQWGECECDDQWLDDGYCDELCNTASCGWEKGDCAYPFRCDQCQFVRLYTPCSYWLSSEIFDDLEEIEPCCEIDIKSVTFEWGEYINGIKTSYKTLTDQFSKGHLGSAVGEFSSKKITFEEEEYIIGVSGKSGWMLNYLVITTSLGNTYEVGDPNSGGADFVVDIPIGFHVVGFGGGKREYIDTLWLYIRAHPDMRCGCNQEILGNSTCDKECYNVECAFDLGDCKISPDCECDENLLFNDECDPHCNIPECWNDLDACKYPDCQCPNDKFNNETCDWEEDCNNEKCHYDDGNCEYPNCHCNPYHIGDGTCNDDCNNPFCNFDNGDCSGSVSCKSCKFNPVGPLGAAADTDSLFDDLIKLDACCDIKLDSLTVLLGAGDVVHGIITEYTYNYKTQTEIRNVVGTEGTPNRIDFEDGETIIRITVTISEGKFVFIEIETTLNVYQFGDPILDGEVSELLLDANYPVVAFYGSISTDTEGPVHVSTLTSLGVYAVLDTTQGCGCLVDNLFEKLFDDVCDLDCYVEECLFDTDGCVECDDCSVHEIYNDECDEHCNTESCIYDNGSCEPLPPGCTCDKDLWENDVCDLACNTVECGHDNGNCHPDCFCDHALIENDECDEECNTEQCLWDNGSCLVSFECCDCKYHHFLPVGKRYEGETTYNDLVEFKVCCQVEIESIYVSILNGYIHTISTSYVSDGEFAFNALREGTEEGTPDSEQTLTMEPGEYIIHVEGHYEDYLTHLKFVTNKGQVFEIGTSSGNEFVFEIHNETEIYNLVGFDGSVSKYIDTLGAFYIIVNACDYSECSYEANRFNDTCDYELCYNEICGYDWNQCEFPECPCDLELLFNGKCDLDCNIEACNGYDSGDCKYPGCQECEENLLENGVCDMKCNTEKCNWDNEKCNKNCDCHPDLFENGECNFECYTEACEFDGGECELPDCKCDLELIYNDVCDYQCNTKECKFDNHKCEPEGCNVCPESVLGDGNCDTVCNIEVCEYDRHDCPYDGCPCTEEEMLTCNPKCNSLKCEFSDQQCGEPEECTACKYEIIGELRVLMVGDLSNFDDFEITEVCCDVQLEAITTYFYNGVIAGFANHYVLDYGTRREIALSVDEQWLLETEGVQEAQFDVPAGALIVKVSGSVSDIGITQITFTLDNGEEYSFGEKQPDEELQVIEVNGKYSVLGFLGVTTGNLIVELRVYVRVNPDEGGCQCDINLLNNGTCDYPDCYTKECNFDGEDCSFPNCPDPNCTVSAMFDDKCQIEHCNHPGCNNHDNEKCIPNCDCDPDVIGDGACNVGCNNEECNSDGGDCPIPNCQCPYELLSNGVCDLECDLEECLWDDSDCITSFQCKECEFREFDPVGNEEAAVVVFDDTLDVEICCQLEITSVEVFYSDTCIVGMRTTYVNDGKLVGDIVRGNIAGFASEVLDLEKGDAIVAAGVSVDGAIVEVRFSTKNGYDFTVGFSAGDSYDFEVPSENDGELFEVIAFQGSYNDECLTTFSAYYQLVDACSCDEDLLRNNNFCDGKCYNKLCGYDWDECPKECSCDASLTLIFNGVCDLDCNNESCNFDNGACPVDGCDICDEELKNDECDLKCNTKECNYDNGKCKPGCDCHPDMLGDGQCNYLQDCWTDECDKDKDDCPIDPECHCDVPQIYNGVCDYECNYQACGYDNGSCEPYPGCDICKINLLGNGECNPLCNVEKCEYDGGDCENPGCQCEDKLLGNDTCNEECNNPDCQMDGGDCDEPNECGCSFYRAGPIGGTSNGAAFDYLQLSELCCHYFIRALVIGGTDEPTPRINTLVIYVEKDSFTEVEVVGFDGSNSVSVNNYFQEDLTATKQYVLDLLAARTGTHKVKIFEDNEYIVEISGLASDIINKLVFKTNHGDSVEVDYGNGTKEMKINLRKYGVVSFFGKRDVTGNAFAKLGFWIVRIETAQETCDDYVRIGDGECDYDSHYNLLCEWDGGDCDPPSDCKCTTEQLHNKTCDWECNTEECEYDMGSCHPQGCTCDPEVFKNNDICDLHCNTKTCGYDPDCPVAGCQECSHDLLNNDQCDEKCNIYDCVWDNWKCTDTYECEDCRFETVEYCPDRTMELTAESFDDQQIVSVCCQLEFTDVGIVTLNGVIVGLEVQYKNEGIPFANLIVHGSTHGTKEHFQVNDGERVTKVVGTSDASGITSLTFYTNKGREQTFGTAKGDEFDLSLIPEHLAHKKIENEEYYVVSFFGYTTSSGIVCLGLHYQVIDVCDYTYEQKYNEKCDPELMSDVCGNDFGQCNECDCDPATLLNDVCDYECNTKECNYDNDAGCTVPGCTACEDSLLSNGKCDLNCNIESCNYDNGECIPDCFCDQSLIGNGQCDLSCNTTECQYDGNECIPGCHCWDDLFNNCCTQECNTLDCQWDKGECTESFGCQDCEYVKRPLAGYPWLYPGVQSFDDLVELNPCCDIKITRVEIFQDLDIVGVQTTYRVNGETFVILHGLSGDEYIYYDYPLEEEEYIVAIQVAGSTTIEYIKLTSNTSNEIEAGFSISDAVDVDIPNGFSVSGFYGYTLNDELLSIGVYIPSSSEASCNCGYALLYNKVCDEECNTAACDNDNGDCSA